MHGSILLDRGYAKSSVRLGATVLVELEELRLGATACSGVCFLSYLLLIVLALRRVFAQLACPKPLPSYQTVKHDIGAFEDGPYRL